MKTLNLKSAFLLFLACLAFAHARSQQKAKPSNYVFSPVVTGKGDPILFIPGYDCSGDVWKETVAYFSSNHECHVLTLPGFAGQPAIITDSLLKKERDEIIRYIKENHLRKPTLIGHSLGGFLALSVSSTSPNLIGKVISVDGLPFLGSIMTNNPNATVNTVKPMASQIRASIETSSPEQAAIRNRQYLSGMLNDTSHYSEILTWEKKSDQKASGQAFYELLTTDIRPDMSKIQSPILVLGSWIAAKPYGASHESAQQLYQAQFAAAKNAKILLSDTGKHFLMYDDQKWMLSEINKFINNKKE